MCESVRVRVHVWKPLTHYDLSGEQCVMHVCVFCAPSQSGEV